MEKLTYMNCHRAVKVRSIDEPEKVYKFEYHAVKTDEGGMFPVLHHRLTNETTCDTLTVRDYNRWLSQYEVVEFNGRRNLADLDRAAIDANRMSSMDAERSGRVEIIGYEQELNELLDKTPTELQDECYQKFHSHIATILAREGRIASPMITGRANFNVRRNDKAYSSYDSAITAFRQWVESWEKHVHKYLESKKSPAERADEEWLKLKKEIDNQIEAIKDIDNGAPYYRTSFTNSISGKVERLAKNGKAELVRRAVEYVSEESPKLKKPIFTKAHKFWKMVEVAENVSGKQEERASQENKKKDFGDFMVVKNFAEDRLQILFDDKPDYSMRAKLKSNGFRWSPRNEAWQRQLTGNAYFAASRVLNVEVRELAAV